MTAIARGAAQVKSRIGAMHIPRTGRISTRHMELPIRVGNTKVVLGGGVLPAHISAHSSAEALRESIQAQVTRGGRLVRDVLAGTHAAACTADDARDICWYLQGIAATQGFQSPDGAFNIADPQERLFSFLAGSPEAYARNSSHLQRLQTEGNIHHGIDISGGPSGFRTALFGKIPGGRLFFKCESHGMYLSRPRGRVDRGVLPPSAGSTRRLRWADIPAAAGHSFSFVTSLGKRSATGTFKERIPDKVKNGYRSLMKQARATGNHELLKALKAGDPLSTAGGIRLMCQNLAEARKHTSDAHFLAAAGEFEAGLKASYRDTCAVRFGNEVVTDGLLDLA